MSPETLPALLRMVSVIRQQAIIDAFAAPVPIAISPLCAWVGCQHRAQHEHGPGSVPERECLPHHAFGEAYEAARPYASAIIGLGSIGAWGATALTAPTGAKRDAGKAGALEGLRTLLSTILTRR